MIFNINFRTVSSLIKSAFFWFMVFKQTANISVNCLKAFVGVYVCLWGGGCLPWIPSHIKTFDESVCLNNFAAITNSIQRIKYRMDSRKATLFFYR